MRKKKILLFLLLGILSVKQLLAQTDESSKYDWKKVVIGGGGYVTGIVFSEARRNVIYNYTDVGGAYRWDSINNSWIQLLDFTSSWYQKLVESVAADPTDENRVYIAVGGQTNSSDGGIFWSTDQGKTLTYVNTPFKMAGNNAGRGKGERLVIDPNSPNILYYGSRIHGLYKSTDYAKTWTKVATFPVSTTTDGGGLCFVLFNKMSSTPGNPTKDIYVGVSQNGNSLYKSSDAGATWAVLAGTPASLQPHRADIDTSGRMYITYASDQGPGWSANGAVWRYNTKISVWTQIPLTNQSYGGISVDKSSPGTIMLASDQSWGGGSNLYRIKDNGATFTVKTISKTDIIQTATNAPYALIGGQGIGNWTECLRIDPFNSNRVMYVTGAGIWASNDVTKIDASQTSNWTFAVKGMEEAGAYEIVSPPSGAMLFSGFGDIGGFRHLDLTVSPSVSNCFGWTYGHGIDFAQNNPNIVVRNTSANPSGFISTNNGASWTAFASQAVPGAASNGEKIFISANGTFIVWAPENLVPYCSKNKGASWVVCKGLPSPAGGYSMISDRVNNNKFYFYDKASGYLYISVDGGENYTKAGYIATWGKRIAANPTLEGDLWVPVSGQGTNGVWHSVNSGKSFVKIPIVQSATSVSLGKAAPGKNYPTIYINGSINNNFGIHCSSDSALTWAKINDAQHQYGGTVDFVVADQRTYGRVYLSPNCLGIPYSQLKYDCHGDLGGSAYYDWCDSCVGGNTGKVSTCTDCNGVVNGTAFKDVCGKCVGGNTGKYPCAIDCNGDSSGTAYFDNCATCVGGKTGKTACVLDCNNIWGGTAYKDNCLTCVGGTTGKQACIQDCNGVWGGKAYKDACDSCVGGNTGIKACTKDCNGVVNGKAFFDICGTCVDTTKGEKPCITSVNTFKSESFSFKPNPFTQSLQLSLLVPSEYRIISISGEIAESGFCQNDCLVGTKLISGFYFLTIRNQSEQKTVKIIKQ